jgi:AraC family transcriptional regulator
MNMKKAPIESIDFRKKDGGREVFLRPALLSSHHTNWTDLHFELHQQPGNDTGEHCLAQHNILASLCSVSSQRWLDGQFQAEAQTPGTVGLMPADVTHRSAWNREAQFMFCALEPLFLKQIGMDLVNPDRIQLIPHFSTVQDPLIYGILLGLREELTSGGLGGTLYVDQLKNTLGIHLLRKYCTSTPKIVNYSNELSSVKRQKAISYIKAHLDREIKLEAIAAEVGMSQYYFSRLFKQSIGVSPYQYVMQQRIERTQYLLKTTSLSIAAIAEKVGFSHQNQLTVQFCKVIGTPPSQYRQKL